MANDISVKEAESILADKEPHHHFWLKDGRPLKNLKELHDAVSTINEETFKHHVTHDRNDFSNWVLHVHQDKELAKKLSEASTRKEIKKMVRDRIGQLESVVNANKKELEQKVRASPEQGHAVKKTAKKLATKARHVKKSLVSKPAKKELGATKTAAEEVPILIRHNCPTKHFLKCSSVHFVLGAIAGFLLGLVIASMI